jgi:hypothetical protein
VRGEKSRDRNNSNPPPSNARNKSYAKRNERKKYIAPKKKDQRMIDTSHYCPPLRHHTRGRDGENKEEEGEAYQFWSTSVDHD